MLTSGAHAHGHRKPFAALDRFRSNDLRRVFLVVARMHLAELRRELLRLLARRVHTRSAEAQRKEKHGGSGGYGNSTACCHLVTSDQSIESLQEPVRFTVAYVRASPTPSSASG